METRSVMASRFILIIMLSGTDKVNPKKGECVRHAGIDFMRAARIINLGRAIFLGDTQCPMKPNRLRTLLQYSGARPARQQCRHPKEVKCAGRQPKLDGPQLLPRATHEAILNLGDKEIQCAVLEDGRRLLTQETFLLAIGRSARPKAGTGIVGSDGKLDKMPSFLAANNLKPFINNELNDSTSGIAYCTTQGNKGHGFIATLLPEVCRVYVNAASGGKVWKSQQHVADACRIIHDSLADVGIISLIDEVTGYQYERPRLALQEFLAHYINKRLAAWEPTFPAKFYRELYRLKGWPYDPDCNLSYSVCRQDHE